MFPPAGSLPGTCRLIFLPGAGLIGIATSKKIGGKPARNTQKRRFREILRQHPAWLNPNVDSVVVLSERVAARSFEELTAEAEQLFQALQAKWSQEHPTGTDSTPRA